MEEAGEMDLDLSEAGVFGEPNVVRVQRVLFNARAWITEQEGMASHGRALLLFHAHRLPADRIEALVRCFERVLMHAPQAEVPRLVATLREAGARVDQGLSLVGAGAPDARAAADAHERQRPFPAGFTLAEVAPDAPAELIRAVQELQAAAGQTPLPGWYLRGAEGRALTLALRDPAGAVAGAATVCAIARPGENAARAAKAPAQLGFIDGHGSEIPPLTGTPVCACLREDARGQGISPTLTSAALRAACERFGTRFFYGVVRAGDEVAMRMATRCGFAPHPDEGIVLAEA
jgi:GNAT superfamily N-acetyltransferase